LKAARKAFPAIVRRQLTPDADVSREPEYMSTEWIMLSDDQFRHSSQTCTYWDFACCECGHSTESWDCVVDISYEMLHAVDVSSM